MVPVLLLAAAAAAAATAASPAAAATAASPAAAAPAASPAAAAPPALYVVDISSAPLPTQVAVQVCSGLFNRNTSTNAPAAYTLLASPDTDRSWLATLYNISQPQLTPVPAFLAACLAGPAQHQRLRWNYTAQREVAPALITMAAVLDAVPLEDGDPAGAGTNIVFDALKTWQSFGEINATTYLLHHYINATAGMAMMDPGYDAQKNPVRPPLTGHLDPGLIDYIVKARLFNFFLYQGCVPGTPEHQLLTTITTSNPWPLPLGVWGYNDAYPIAGDLFEAESLCTRAHSMGQIASVGFNNLAFFSRAPAISQPLPQNPPVAATYSPQTTYLALVVGDGDNISFLKSTRAQWMNGRTAACRANATTCYPLVWTLSPHAAQVAPLMARWFFAQSYSTARDYFILPPSGHLYAYPGMMDSVAQAAFVSATERDAQLYSTDGSIDWEWFTEWNVTMATLYPAYGRRGIVRGIFPVNVPFLFPVEQFGKDEFYKVYNRSSVAFRPREWRGPPSHAIPLSKKEYLSVEDMAAEVNGYPRGTAAYIYLTSDGGANLTQFDGLVSLLDPHVKVVDHSTLVDMALAADARRNV